MKRFLNVLMCGLVLYAIEYILLLCFFQAEHLIKYQFRYYSFSKGLRDANEISAVRFIFYFGFWVAAVHFLFPVIKIKHKLVKLAFVNVSLYVSISLLMTVFFPFAMDFFKDAFFFYLVISTMASPFLMRYIPRVSDIIYKI